MESMLDVDLGRRNLLRGVFLGLGAASLPTWMLKNAVAQTGGPALEHPARVRSAPRTMVRWSSRWSAIT